MNVVHSTGPFPEVTWFVTAASGLGCASWEGCQPDEESEHLSQISNKSEQAFLLHRFGSLSMYTKSFPADLTNLHWQVFSDSAQVSLTFKNVQVRCPGMSYLSVPVKHHNSPHGFYSAYLLCSASIKSIRYGIVNSKGRQTLNPSLLLWSGESFLCTLLFSRRKKSSLIASRGGNA